MGSFGMLGTLRDETGSAVGCCGAGSAEGISRALGDSSGNAADPSHSRARRGGGRERAEDGSQSQLGA
jgi:hypothetical protein